MTETLSVAGELRAAATLMRERAEAATPGPWIHLCMGSDSCTVVRKSRSIRDRGFVATFSRKQWHADHADAAHVAGMSPAVALAVADWLDACGSAPEGTQPMSVYAAALIVAREYMGET